MSMIVRTVPIMISNGMARIARITVVALEAGRSFLATPVILPTRGLFLIKALQIGVYGI